MCTTSEYEAEIMTILEQILKFAYPPFIDNQINIMENSEGVMADESIL